MQLTVDINTKKMTDATGMVALAAVDKPQLFYGTRETLEFTFLNDGEPVNFRIAKSVDPLLDREAIRVLQLMPNWKPGTQRGNPVSVEYTVPINFQLQ